MSPRDNITLCSEQNISRELRVERVWNDTSLETGIHESDNNNIKTESKINFILEQTKKAQMGNRGIALLFLYLPR